MNTGSCFIYSTQAMEFVRKSGAILEITEFENNWYFYGTESDSNPVLESTAMDYYMVFGINYRFSWD